jgi:hypothetical protein
VAANEELRNAGCVGRLEEMLALSSVVGQVDVKTRYPRIGVRASERIVNHSYKGMRGLVSKLDLFGSLISNSAQRRDLSGELFDSERDCYVALN